MEKNNINLSKIAAIESELFSDAWSEESIVSTLKQDYNHICYITEGDEICGYLIYSLVCGEAELLRVGVKRASQGKKYGNKIMDIFFDELRSENAEKIFLEVRSNNIVARNMYDKYGFAEIAVRKNYYKNPDDDAIFMECILDN